MNENLVVDSQYISLWVSLAVQVVKNLPAMQETLV